MLIIVGAFFMKKIKDTSEVLVPDKLIDQVIGQDKAVELVKKAAAQRRNVLLIGDPGTGKSMLAQAMAELLPVEKLEDILVYPNVEDENNPRVVVAPAGQGKKIVDEAKKKQFMEQGNSMNMSMTPMLIMSLLYALGIGAAIYFKLFSDILLAAFIIVGGLFLGFLIMAGVLAVSFKGMKLPGMKGKVMIPKLLVNNFGRNKAPFVDATGARAGALLGDVKHDPYQCIPAGEKIFLASGKPVNIEDLVEPFIDENKIESKINAPYAVLGGSDAGFSLVPAGVKKVYKRFYEGNLIEVKTKSGLVLKSTPNHPFAFLDDYLNIDYTSAENLSKGGFVVVSNSLPLQNKKVDVPFELFGDILADAYVGQRSVKFKFGRKFKIKTICEDIKKANLSFVKREKEYTEIDVNSSSFVNKLREIGLINEKHKRIPDAVFEADMHSILLFVSRLLSLDGHVTKKGQFEILSSQKDLLFDLQALLLKFGVKASYRPRLDTGFAKGKLQHRLTWANYEWAKLYYKLTVNPVHKKNLENYFSKTSFKNVAFHDEIPINFNYLEGIRESLNISKEKVHGEYYALNQNLSSSKKPTRAMLQKVYVSFKNYGANGQASYLERLVNGNYAFDEIVSIKKVPYRGYVYNLTTETGNYIVNGILTHNSGGLGTPPHLRVEAGMIHKANKGVLYIDEVATLSPKSQQELLTAMQDKKYSITGQSEMSSGAMVHTQPVPCEFLLIASGNLVDLQKMHPALRSRIRGYGYEVYLNDKIEDTPKNRDKVIQFVAQEVKKDGKIPHFKMDAVEEIIFEARRRASSKNKLTLHFRDLGGLIRAAGDIARTKGHELVTRADVVEAKKLARTLEQQMADKVIDIKKEYEVIKTKGFAVGRVNGLAVMGGREGYGGLLLPIEAVTAPAQSLKAGKTIATGKLGEIAKEAVQNVFAIIKKYKGKGISSYDVHVQFLQTYEGVEGDSASVSIATAVISALEKVPVKQEVAMTGSLSVKGEVLPVGGVSAKIEAAIESGAKIVIIPEANKSDVVLNKKKLGKIKILTANDLVDVLKIALKNGVKKKKLLSSIKKAIY